MRIALVTGGAGGLGLATAKQFARYGLRVVIADLELAVAEAAARQLDGEGHRGLAIDVASEDSVVAAFATVERDIGPIAVLAHFAGMLGAGGTATGISLMESTVEDWDRVMWVNARGSFLCAREFARHRRGKPVAHGRVITISSLAGQAGGLQSGAAYSASKAAVLGLMRTAARDLAALGVTVNAIAPGPIDTPMLARATGATKDGAKYTKLDAVPLGRVGLPDEIAAAASFLASVNAGYVTGATIDVNGGLLMR
jgi:3-oxoacyl-[acyl-carrier protein] reductase